jgi:hypothetical protein
MLEQYTILTRARRIPGQRGDIVSLAGGIKL